MLDGSGLGVSNKEAEVQQIQHENAEKLASMSQEEILEEQKRLLEMIGTIDFYKRNSTPAIDNFC